MKKIKHFLLTMVLMLCSVFCVACFGTKITSGYVKAGTLATSIIKDSVLDTSNVIAVFKYSDNTLEEISSDKLTFSAFDSSVLGEQDLMITYKDFSFKVKIKVVASDADVVSINQLESQLLTDFNSAKNGKFNFVEDEGGQAVEKSEFYDSNQPLFVGDDNVFNFRIIASGVDATGNLVSGLTKVRTNIMVEIDNQGVYEKLTGAELDALVQIDTEYSTLDFSQDAVGKRFRVTVEAANRDQDYEEAATKFVAELEVVDGYNVYNAKQLAYYDNSQSGWNDIKSKLEGSDFVTNGIILQDDINIKKDDVREDVFWTQERVDSYPSVKSQTDQTIVGTPIDYYNTGIYKRVVTNGETFNFIGNYFSVSLKEFPKMVIQGHDGSDNEGVFAKDGKNEIMTAHMCVFYNDKQTSEISKPTLVNCKNISFIGNGEKNNDPKNSGAILLMKQRYVNLHAYNTFNNNFYIGYFVIYGDDNNEFDGNFIIEKCKGYNSYQCLLYSYGGENMLVKDSEFISAGGPAIITDHEYSGTDYKTGYAARTDFVNTIIRSKVTGKEPWFTYYGAGELVGQLTTAEQLYSGMTAEGQPNGLAPTGKTIYAGYVDDNGVQIPLLNIVAAMKKGGSPSLTGERIGGHIRMFKNMGEYEKYYALNGQTQEYTTFGLDMDKNDSLMNKAYGSSLIYLESNGNGGYINSGFGTANTDSSITTGKSYSEGDYINLYLYNGMGAIIGLYDAQ